MTPNRRSFSSASQNTIPCAISLTNSSFGMYGSRHRSIGITPRYACAASLMTVSIGVRSASSLCLISIFLSLLDWGPLRTIASIDIALRPLSLAGFQRRRCWRHAPVRLREQRTQIGGGHRGESHQYRRKPTVMRLGEELGGLRGNEELPLAEIRDADGEHFGIGHARLLRVDPLLPHPGESLELVLDPNREGEVTRCLFRVGQGEGDATDVSLSGHG